MILWSLFALVKPDVGATTSQPPADEKLVELQKTHLEGTSALLVQKSGGEKQESASLICKSYKP